MKSNIKYPGYEVLVYEIMLGDRSCLLRRVGGENSWNRIDRVLEVIENEKRSF